MIGIRETFSMVSIHYTMLKKDSFKESFLRELRRKFQLNYYFCSRNVLEVGINC